MSRSVLGGHHRAPKKPPVTDVIPNCPVCGKVGQVISPRITDVLNLVCDCGHKWQSLSNECKCGELTGFVVDGYCQSCYREYLVRKGVA
ncbi:hypothetical protein [Sporomusa paucivorans]|uniref:hypothetical protein n=1 Tax=Sporomusa paucivorans TaxID=2376 RepID=UPI0035710F0A